MRHIKEHWQQMSNIKMREIIKEIDSSGFARIENLFLQNEVDKCESIMDLLMQRNSISTRLLTSNMSENPAREKNQQTEFTRPSMVSRNLRKSEIFTRCQEVAQAYFGGKAYYLFDHAIYKMPGSKTITPWHQDQAYLGTDMIPGIHFWIPFQNTDINNGAMQFVKGSHHKRIPHKQAYMQNPHILQAEDIPEDNIYTMDINRGDASLHTNLTLHSATANNSDCTRKAWIIHFGPKPQWHKHWLTLKGRILGR